MELAATRAIYAPWADTWTYPAHFGRSNCVSAEITETSVQRHFGPEISVSVSAGRPDGRYGTNDDVVTINSVSSIFNFNFIITYHGQLSYA